MTKEKLAAEITDRLVRGKYSRYWGGGRGGGHGFVLSYLAEHEGKALSGEICQAMGGSTPRIAAILRDLEKDELILRAAVEHDRRKVCVTLTEAGKEKAAAKQRRLEQFAWQLLEQLSEEDANALPRILDALEKIPLEHPKHFHKETQFP